MAGLSSTSWTLLRSLGQTPLEGESWERFVRQYGPAVFQWCKTWGLQDADADDVTQTVLLKLVDHMKEFQYDPNQSFRGWLRTVAYHAWVKFCMTRQKAIGAGSGALETVEAKEDLAARLEREYDRELLDLAMMRVSQRVEQHTWDAFRLTALENHSGAEVARRLNLQVGTVYVARSKVQRMIQEEIQALDQS